MKTPKMTVDMDRSCTWNGSGALEEHEQQDKIEELLVKGTEQYGHPWVKYTEQNYTRVGLAVK